MNTNTNIHIRRGAFNTAKRNDREVVLPKVDLYTNRGKAIKLRCSKIDVLNCVYAS